MKNKSPVGYGEYIIIPHNFYLKTNYYEYYI